MKTLPFAEAGAKLSLLVDRVAAMDEGWKETRAIQSDRELMAEIGRGLRGLRKKGRIYTLKELIPDE